LADIKKSGEWETLSDEEKVYADKVMKKFKRHGTHLNKIKREKLIALRIRQSELKT